MSRTHLAAPYMPQAQTEFEFARPYGVAHLMPAYGDIPEDFRRDHGDAKPWIEFQRVWFERGLPAGTTFAAKPGVDLSTALRHLRAIQASFEASHEHKEAAVAYLASLWFEAPPSTGEGETTA